ncbi:unnamed protein product, partial [Echinostoma caproni]|uniref:NAD(P)-binding protein n=1 Tax=Echinostoma caproni TaxID=27848 RepID=A0A183A856_9TREM
MGLRSIWLGFFGSTECSISGRLDGLVAVVTGANTGIGLQLTAELARRGARVIMACRSEEKFQSASSYLLLEYGEQNGQTNNQQLTEIKPEQLLFEQLDLASFESVKQSALSLSSKGLTVNFVVNNAGVLLTNQQAEKELTPDGFNYHLQVNFLSPLLFTLLLLPLLPTDGSARIVFTTSVLRHLARLESRNLTSSSGGLLGARTYAQSKLLATACSRQLAKHLKAKNIRVVSVDPGIVRTNLVREPGWIWN